MRIHILKYCLFTSILVVTASCKKGIGEHKPEGGNESAPPAVTNVAVDNQPGQSVITYTLPADPNLLYVKAIYVLVSGQQAETKATYYSNSITIEGYADTLEHEVKLYSVSRTEITSPPVIVKIKPLESPIWKVFKSINIINAFGGYNLTAANPTKADIALLVFKKNVFNEYEVDNGKSVFTNVESILSKIRGLDTIDYRFGFMVRDKWLNRTDTLFKVIKPLYEAEFSSTKFRTFPLPGDAPQVTNGAALPFMWDGKFGWPYTSFTHQVNGGNGPHMITFDMGATGKVSRIWIRPFPEGTRYYYLSTMKRFEIYGSDNPSLTGALDNTWSLLGSYIVVKPSGQPYGTDSGADQETAAAGFNWEADLSAPKVRYIRIRCLENFAGGTAQSINEIKVYGDPR